MLELIAFSERFGDMLVREFQCQTDEHSEKQFAAMIFLLPDETMSRTFLVLQIQRTHFHDSYFIFTGGENRETLRSDPSARSGRVFREGSATAHVKELPSLAFI